MQLISIERDNNTTKIPIYVAKDDLSAQKAAEKVVMSCLEQFREAETGVNVMTEPIFSEFPDFETHENSIMALKSDYPGGFVIDIYKIEKHNKGIIFNNWVTHARQLERIRCEEIPEYIARAQ